MRSDSRQYGRALVDSLKNASESEVLEKVKRFKKLLYKQGTFKKAGEILMYFSKAWREKDGDIATVVTAKSLSAHTKSSIEKTLQEKNYVIEEEVNPSVIGGVAVQLGNSYLIDGTIKGKLKKIQGISE
jgi:F0F1-type ATP synthase delta subunit